VVHVDVSGEWDHRRVKWDDVTKVAAAVGPVVVALVGVAAASAATHNRRSRLKTDAEVLKLLPENGEARKLLAAHIERAIVRLAEDDEMRRDPLGVVIALMLLGFAGWTGVLALDHPKWWWAAIPLGSMGAYGFVSDAFRAKRDERGRRLRPTREVTRRPTRRTEPR